MSIDRKRIDKITSEISDEIVADDLELIRSCFQCGTCTGSCPSGRRTALRTRAVIRKALLGLDQVLDDPDIWLCSTCYTCFDRCPRNLKVTDAIIELRNLASARGFMSEKHRKTVKILHSTGHAVPINDKIKAVRKELGLEEVPPTIFISPVEIELLSKSLFQVATKGKEGD